MDKVEKEIHRQLCKFLFVSCYRKLCFVIKYMNGLRHDEVNLTASFRRCSLYCL